MMPEFWPEKWKITLGTRKIAANFIDQTLVNTLCSPTPSRATHVWRQGQDNAPSWTVKNKIGGQSIFFGCWCVDCNRGVQGGCLCATYYKISFYTRAIPLVGELVNSWICIKKSLTQDYYSAVRTSIFASLRLKRRFINREQSTDNIGVERE